ncbi:MAG: hypothetical protein N3D10_03580 [Candidatus Micrarchaeota archaeon]|nr:hypothetical protein [Candidatus Micrarchaeota archaeon]
MFYNFKEKGEKSLELDKQKEKSLSRLTSIHDFLEVKNSYFNILALLENYFSYVNNSKDKKLLFDLCVKLIEKKKFKVATLIFQDTEKVLKPFYLNI